MNSIRCLALATIMTLTVPAWGQTTLINDNLSGPAPGAWTKVNISVEPTMPDATQENDRGAGGDWSVGGSEGSGASPAWEGYYGQSFAAGVLPNGPGDYDVNVSGWVKAWAGWWGGENWDWRQQAALQLWIDGTMVWDARAGQCDGYSSWNTWVQHTHNQNHTINTSIELRLYARKGNNDCGTGGLGAIYYNSRFDDILLQVTGDGTPVPTDTPSGCCVNQAMVNPSFENGSGGTATGWTNYGNTDGRNSNMAFVYSGAHSFGAVTNWSSPKTGGAFQQIQVCSGASCEVTAYVYNNQTGGSSTDVSCRIGIDPFGDTNPASGSIVWTALTSTTANWQQIGLTGGNAVTAQTATVTVFVEHVQNIALEWNWTYLDTLTFSAAGGSTTTCTPVPATDTPTPPPACNTPAVDHAVWYNGGFEDNTYCYATGHSQPSCPDCLSDPNCGIANEPFTARNWTFSAGYPQWTEPDTQMEGNYIAAHYTDGTGVSFEDRRFMQFDMEAYGGQAYSLDFLYKMYTHSQSPPAGPAMNPNIMRMRPEVYSLSYTGCTPATIGGFHSQETLQGDNIASGDPRAGNNLKSYNVCGALAGGAQGIRVRIECWEEHAGTPDNWLKWVVDNVRVDVPGPPRPWLTTDGDAFRSGGGSASVGGHDIISQTGYTFQGTVVDRGNTLRSDGQAVELAIRRTSDNFHWNGSSFVSGVQFVSATLGGLWSVAPGGNHDWHYDFAYSGEGTFMVTLRATTAASNGSYPGSATEQCPAAYRLVITNLAPTPTETPVATETPTHTPTDTPTHTPTHTPVAVEDWMAY